jgi:hypothetical protein
MVDHQKRVIKLYKNLFKYSQHLQLTDPKYFINRVREAFKQNKNISTQLAEERLKVSRHDCTTHYYKSKIFR